MKKPKINKKIVVPIIVGVIFALGFSILLQTSIVSAQSGELPPYQVDPTANTITSNNGPAGGNITVDRGDDLSGLPGNIAKGLFRFLGSVFVGLGSFLLGIALQLFQGVLTEGFNGRPEIATTGWNVCRDIANMFFILFMVIIAFATILRIERYGVKELLPKLIGVALLINFSMVLCFVLIDFTNIAADFFIKNAQTNVAGTTTPLSKVFLDGLQVTRTLTASFCEQHLLDKEACPNVFTNTTERQKCEEVAQKKFDDCKISMKGIQEQETENETLMHVIVSQFGTALILFIAAFIIFAGAFILIIRSIAIWFLVIISPLALVCLILPALRKNWESWLQQFTKWCIFAPIYAFFIWLAAKICIQGTIDRVASLQSNLFTDSTGSVNQFFSDIKYIYNFIFIGAFLIGGLIVANKMGMAGASSAMTLGKKWKNAGVGWVKKQTVGRAKERVGGGLDRARGAALANVGKLFGNTSMGRSMRARGSMASQSATQREYNKKYATRLSMMSKDDTLKEVEKASGAQKLLAARTAQNRGFLREAEKEQVASAINAFANFGDVDSSRKLAELRPDAVTGNDRKEAEQRAIASGTHKQWGEKVFEGTDGAEIAEDLREQLGTGEFTKVFNGWAKDVRDKCEKALRSGLTDDFKNADNAKKRKDFASITGKLDQAFYGDKDGKLNTEYSIDSKTKTIKPEWDNLVGSHIRGFKDEDWGKLKSVTDKTLAAKYMTAAQVDGAGPKLSGSDKQFVKNILEELIKTLPDTDPHKAERQKTYEAITASTAWGGKPQTTTTPPVGGTPEQRKDSAWEAIKEEAKKQEEEKRK
jgi:hypothetical protein